MAKRTNFVFLHGGAQGSWVWDETIAALKASGGSAVGHCLALDIPGCGTKRDRIGETIGFNDIVDELLADIADSGVEQPVLVGHSQAGTVIPRLIEELPGRFDRAIYVTCLAPAPGDPTFADWVMTSIPIIRRIQRRR